MGHNLFKWMLVLAAVTLMIIPAFALLKSLGYVSAREKSETSYREMAQEDAAPSHEKQTRAPRLRFNDTTKDAGVKNKYDQTLSGAY